MINSVVERLLVLIFSLLVLDVLWQVVSRYALGSPSSFTEEFARFSLIWLAILSTAYLSGQRAHLAMDYWIRKLPQNERQKRDFVIECLILGFVIVVFVIGGTNLVYTTLRLGQQSAVLEIPLGIIYGIVPFSGLIMIFYSAYHMQRILKSWL
jgi:TRAP-type C4-dicarboxylate transport system permease small subunit